MKKGLISRKNHRVKGVVLVGGCFDILHFGHLMFLKKARKLGDHLIILLESDESVRKLKGVGRPINKQKLRHYMLTSLKFVDEVVDLKGILRNKDYENLVTKIQPGVIAVTSGDPAIGKKRQQAKMTGARFVVVPKVKVVSTTKIAKLLGFQ